jgi:hypothetical protein
MLCCGYLHSGSRFTNKTLIAAKTRLVLAKIQSTGTRGLTFAENFPEKCGQGKFQRTKVAGHRELSLSACVPAAVRALKG